MAQSVEYELLLKNGTFKQAAKESEAAMRDVGSAVKGVRRDIERIVSSESTRMSNVLKGLAKTIGGVFTMKAAYDFSRQIVAVRQEVESLEISFKTLLGNEAKANKLLGELREYAVKTPLQLNDLAKSAQTLLAFDIEAEKIMPTLKAIGDISMGDAQKLQSLTLAFAQISSNGKLMGQDLLQLINAGFNPLTVIAEKTGKSIAELKDEMSKGAITAEMVSDAFMDATSEGGKFYGMLEKQSQSLGGAFSNLQGAVSDMMNSVGESMQGPLAGTVNMLTKVVQNYKTLGGVIATMVASFGTYKVACMTVTAVQMALKEVTVATTAAQKAQIVITAKLKAAHEALKASMIANPYVFAATAVAALVTGLLAYTRSTRDARTEQQKLNDLLKEGSEAKQELNEKTNDLIDTVADESKSDLKRYQAYKELQALYPEYLKNVSQEVFLREKLDEFKDDAPNIIDENELRRMKEVSKYIPLLTKYLEYKKSMEGGYTGAAGLNSLNEFNSLKEEMGNAFDEDFFQSVYDKFKDSGFKSAEEFAKAVNAGIMKREQEIKDAAFEKLTINQKIAITESSIASVKMRIGVLKKEAEKDPINFKVKLDLKQAENELDELMNKMDALQSSKVDNNITLKSVTDAIADANKKLAAARKKGQKDELKKAQDELDEAKKDYKLLTGKEYDTVVKNAADAKIAQKKAFRELEKAEKEFSDRLVKQARESAFDRRQAWIDGLEDGTEEKLEQIDLDYEKEIAAVEDYEEQLLDELRDMEEKRWNATNPGKVKNGESFDRNQITSNMLTIEQRSAIVAMENEAEKRRQRAIREAQRTKDELLAQYSGLEEQIKAIREKYGRLRTEAGDNVKANEGITMAERKEIASLVLDTFKANESIGQLAERVSELGKNARAALTDKLFKILQFAQKKRTLGLFKTEDTADFARMNSVSEEFLNTIINNNEALKEFEEYIKNIGNTEPIDNLTEAVKRYRQAVDRAKNGDIVDEDALEKAKETMDNMIQELANNILDEISAIGDMLMQLGDMLDNDKLSSAGEFLNDFTSNLQAAEQGAQAWGGWWGAIIGGVTDLIPKIVKWATSNKEAEKAISELDKSIQRTSYDLQILDAEMSNGTTTEQFWNKYRMLYSQVEDARAKWLKEFHLHDGDQFNEEVQQALYDYRNYLSQLEDLWEDYFSFLSGTNVTGLFDDMLDMIWDAFEHGKDAIDDFGAYFNKMLLNMIKKQVMWNLIGEQLETYIKDLTWHLSEGHLTGDEAVNYINWLRSYLGDILQEGLAGLEALEPVLSLLSDKMENSADTLTGSIKGITAEQAGVLAGQTNAIRMAQYEQIGILTDSLHRLDDIERNTRYIKQIYDIVRGGTSKEVRVRAYGN